MSINHGDPALEQSLYAKREKIYPREVHGLFALYRTAGVAALLGIYYAAPWLRFNHEQAILFDLPNRKFHFFDRVFWPQDFVYVVVLMIIAGLGLFFFTALAGRLWCGYACPQTVWTELFLFLERKIEGDRQRQMKLDRAPWSFRKARIKLTKHVSWLLIAGLTGFTFVGYFTPIQALSLKFVQLELGAWEDFWIVFFTVATYANAGWMREQVCKYMCPYARFQSAMFDEDTLIISYDRSRGEPRGGRARGTDPRAQGLGDCIDCGMCTQVCPTGIDIRNGLQYECIGCAACVDVCNDVMRRMQYPKGLIRYTTLHALQGKNTSLLRPRLLVYSLLLLVLSGGLLYALAQRIPFELDVIRDRSMLYQPARDGRIENIYTVKILNKDNRSHRYRLAVSGAADLRMDLERDIIEGAAGDVIEIPVRVNADPAKLTTMSSKILFSLESLDAGHRPVVTETRFIGPS